MILCIDSTKLTRSNTVQKPKLEGLLLNHTKFYDSAEEAKKDLYVPLDFAIAIRTDADKILQITDDNGTYFFPRLVDIPRYIHKGYDLVMFLASLMILENVNYSLEYETTMVKYSAFIPVGIYNPFPELINPVILSNIIISESGLEDFRHILKDGRKFVTFSEASNLVDSSVKPLFDAIMCKKEDSNE